jgi:hypothetical protein
MTSKRGSKIQKAKSPEMLDGRTHGVGRDFRMVKTFPEYFRARSDQSY